MFRVGFHAPDAKVMNLMINSFIVNICICCKNDPAWYSLNLFYSISFPVLLNVDSCDGVKCQENQKCVVKNGVPKCVCAPNCNTFRLENGIKGRVRGPVCGCV